MREMGGTRQTLMAFTKLLFTALSLVGLGVWAYRNDHLTNVGFPCISDMVTHSHWQPCMRARD